MLQDIIVYIGSLPPSLVYLAMFIFAFIENVFPPSPSDLIVVIGATLISNTGLNIFSILLITSIGSTLGFIIMYFVGEYFGGKILRNGRIKFIKAEYLEKADHWFHKYGYKLILINRFMPGTRAVMSFFTGVHRLKPVRTFVFASISALFWNTILIYLGVLLGQNVELIDHYLKSYSNIILIVTVVVVVILLVRFWLKKKKS